MLFQIFQSLVICLKDSGLRTGLNSHVAESHTVADA